MRLVGLLVTILVITLKICLIKQKQIRIFRTGQLLLKCICLASCIYVCVCYLMQVSHPSLLLLNQLFASLLTFALFLCQWINGARMKQQLGLKSWVQGNTKKFLSAMTSRAQSWCYWKGGISRYSVRGLNLLSATVFLPHSKLIVFMFYKLLKSLCFFRYTVIKFVKDQDNFQNTINRHLLCHTHYKSSRYAVSNINASVTTYVNICMLLFSYLLLSFNMISIIFFLGFGNSQSGPYEEDSSGH